MNLQNFTLDKISAAQRQIREAVRLFFLDGDIVAVHTLAAAAQGVLEDISTQRGTVTSHKQQVELALQNKPDLQKIWHQSWVKAENFLKHADRDANDFIEFRPMWTATVLYDAIWLFEELTGKRVPATRLFGAWYTFKTRIFDEVDHPFAQKMAEVAEGLDPTDQSFWAREASKI